MSIVVLQRPVRARAVARIGERALERRAGACADGVVRVGRVEGEARVLGAFERAVAGHVRRVSGGPTIAVAEGTVHVLVAVNRYDAVDRTCDAPSKLVNRYVRPLLRGLARIGAPARWFGRDWVSVARRPAAWIGFAHEVATGRAAVEAFVAVATPFAVDPARASYGGAAPATLVELAGRDLAVDRVAGSIAQAYADAYGAAGGQGDDEDDEDEDEDDDTQELVAEDDPPWTASIDEAIGNVGARLDPETGAVRIGGDLLVSRDALADLEAAASLASPETDLAALVDRHLGRADVALLGVRPASIAALLALLRLPRS